MEQKEAIKNGLLSSAIALIFTYLVSMVVPNPELTWAMIAVGFASFFSGFFSSYY
ncbi:MAG: hypothetical protein ABEJ56_05935 [Candidatus Nanohaloarchaea archaeon]